MELPDEFLKKMEELAERKTKEELLREISNLNAEQISIEVAVETFKDIAKIILQEYAEAQ